MVNQLQYKRLVLHLCNTPCAGAPGMLSSCIDRYSGWESKVFTNRTVLSAGDFSIDYKNMIGKNQLNEYIDRADIIHYHNEGPRAWNLMGKKEFIIQFHSEPGSRSGLLNEFNGRCITIAQKHATMKGYEKIPIVPNVLPLYDPLYSPDHVRDPNVVVIVYSPTMMTDLPRYEDTCKGKGYTLTMQALKKIEREFGNRVKVLLFTGVKKEDVLFAKTHSDIVIDEVVTGGYHLSALEGLATGNVVIGNINQKVLNVMAKIIGVKATEKKELPWEMSYAAELIVTLRNLIKEKLDHLDAFQMRGRRSASWMRTYWRPEVLVNSFHIPLYNKRLKIDDNPWLGLKVSGDVQRLQALRRKIAVRYEKKSIDIVKYKGSLKGKSVLILGAGPSVNSLNIEKFLAETKAKVFTSNYYFQFQHKINPSFWFNIDGNCLEECLKDVPKDVSIIISQPTKFISILHENRLWIQDLKPEFNRFFRFNFDLERPCTVASIMTLWALYCGASPIYFIGVDLSVIKGEKNYAYEGKYFNDKFRDFSKNLTHILSRFKWMKEEGNRLGIQMFNLDPNPVNFNLFPFGPSEWLKQ